MSTIPLGAAGGASTFLASAGSAAADFAGATGTAAAGTTAEGAGKGSSTGAPGPGPAQPITTSSEARPSARMKTASVSAVARGGQQTGPGTGPLVACGRARP